MRILVTIFLVAVWGFPAVSFGESRLLFLDGARIEQEYAARKGVVEVPLPATILSESLRVKPLGDTAIQRVEIVPLPPDRTLAKQRAALEERREVLRDRLTDLAEREVIFKSAAKSQSGRAVKKTKSNPDPLATLRTGTRFTLSQLDSIASARRQARQSLADVENKLAVLDKRAVPLTAARVWLSTQAGKVRVAYLVSDLKWTPRYDFRLCGQGYAELTVRAMIPVASPAISTTVVALAMAESMGADLAPYRVSSDFAAIASYRLPLAKEQLTKGAVPSLSLAFSNSTGQNLPSGEARGFWQGEYFGKTSFPGCRPGKSLALDFGNQ